MTIHITWEAVKTGLSYGIPCMLCFALGFIIGVKKALPRF